jgi:hypothetical protein|nr:MAG TPA: hypothetical protein [Caudoviricetes sp.]
MLNLDLSQYNPVQADSQYANVPLPSAHLVMIEESEIKESVKDGFTRGTNLLLEMTILASSTGNEFVGEKLPLYIPINGFEDTAIKAGMKRLSTLAYTLGIGGFLQNKEDLHGINFIVVLEKDGKSNFPRFKRILNVNGEEIADASGNFRPCELKDVALSTELEKLLAVLQGGGQPVQQQAQQGNFSNTGAVQSPTQNLGQQQQAQTSNFGGQAQSAPTQNFVPQTNFGQPTQTAQAPSAQPQQGNFGGVPQQPNFGATPNPNAGAWGQTVNPNNGQAAPQA